MVRTCAGRSVALGITWLPNCLVWCICALNVERFCCAFCRVFQRLLHNTFVMRKVLQVRSDRLYKQANPFALNTIKDWVELLAEHERNRRSTSAEPLLVICDSSADQDLTARERPAHPWELKAAELAVGRTIGQGAHGAVFEGKCVPCNVSTFQLVVRSAKSNTLHKAITSVRCLWQVSRRCRGHQNLVQHHIVRHGWRRYFCRNSSRSRRNVENASRKHLAVFRHLLSAQAGRHCNGHRALRGKNTGAESASFLVIALFVP